MSLEHGVPVARGWTRRLRPRTISTFSCDIARAVSRRLRSRRERLAPTAPRLRGPGRGCRKRATPTTFPPRRRNEWLKSASTSTPVRSTRPRSRITANDVISGINDLDRLDLVVVPLAQPVREVIHEAVEAPVDLGRVRFLRTADTRRCRDRSPGRGRSHRRRSYASKLRRMISTFSCDIAYSERPTASRASAVDRKFSFESRLPSWSNVHEERFPRAQRRFPVPEISFRERHQAIIAEVESALALELGSRRPGEPVASRLPVNLATRETGSMCQAPRIAGLTHGSRRPGRYLGTTARSRVGTRRTPDLRTPHPPAIARAVSRQAQVDV